jgi:hypothetical protein
MKRIFHHYKKWEDYNAGMWKKIQGKKRDALLKKAIKFTGNADLYGEWMIKVIKQWPITCEHNLTDLSINRRAFIGHCAVCLAINCPEDITREAWHCLTDRQKIDANRKADLAIENWEKEHIEQCQNDQLELMF